MDVSYDYLLMNPSIQLCSLTLTPLSSSSCLNHPQYADQLTKFRIIPVGSLGSSLFLGCWQLDRVLQVDGQERQLYLGDQIESLRVILFLYSFFGFLLFYCLRQALGAESRGAAQTSANLPQYPDWYGKPHQTRGA